MMIESKNREHGVALLFCLFALLILTAVSTSLVLLANTESSINYNYRTEEVAFFAAKTGIYEALDRMQQSNGHPITVPLAAPSAAGGVLYLINSGGSLTVQPWSTTNTYYDTEFCHEGWAIAGMSSVPADVPCTTIPTGSTWYTTVNSNYPWSGTSAAMPYQWVRINWKPNKGNPYLSASTTGGVTTAATAYYAVNGTGLATTGVCWNGANQLLVSPVNTSTLGCKGMENNAPTPTLDTPVYLVTALSITPNGSRQLVQAEVALPPPPITQVGFFATGSTCSNSGGSAPFVLSGGALVDGYDSNGGGTYSGTKSASLGTIGSNGSLVISSGTTNVGGSVQVQNTALTGGCPSQDVFISGGASIGGVTAMAAPYNPPVPTIPAAGATNETYGSNATLPPGSYHNVTVSGNGVTLTLTAPGTYNVNCITLSGGAILSISPATSQAVINVTGTSCSGSTPIDFSGGSVANTSGIAGNFVVNYAGTSNVKLSGGSASYIVANTPNAAVTLSGGSSLYGAIIGKTIVDSGGTSLHFDNALTSASTASSSYQTLSFKALPY